MMTFQRLPCARACILRASGRTCARTEAVSYVQASNEKSQPLAITTTHTALLAHAFRSPSQLKLATIIVDTILHACICVFGVIRHLPVVAVAEPQTGEDDGIVFGVSVLVVERQDVVHTGPAVDNRPELA